MNADKTLAYPGARPNAVCLTNSALPHRYRPCENCEGDEKLKTRSKIFLAPARPEPKRSQGGV
jgi:hypothetical protein